MNGLLEQFLAEARENLKFIEQNLEFLGNGDEELLNGVFRAAHTMKGGSGIVGFESLKKITHKAEDLLDMLRSHKLEFQPSILDVLFDVFDEALNLVEAAENTGEVVEANCEIEASLIERLNALMGKSDEKVVFKLPFKLLSNKSSLVELNLNLPQREDLKIPLVYDAIGESNLDEERLWGIWFDLTDDCMQFGNDPLYALSLLGGKLLSIVSCIDEDAAKRCLTAAEEDSLNLYMQLGCVAYARYSDIEDALYNFLDDVLLLPLDAATLLSISSGERSVVELLKDAGKEAKANISGSNKDALRNGMQRTVQLLNPNHLSCKMFSRFLQAMPYLDDADLPRLSGFFDAAQQAMPFVFDPLKVECSAPSQPKQPVATTDASSYTAQTDKDRETAKGIVKQQLERAQDPESAHFLPSIAKAVGQCASYLGQSVEMDASSLESVVQVAKTLMGMQAPQPTGVVTNSATSRPVEAQKPSVPVKQEVVEGKKDVIGKVVKVEQESIDMLMSVVGELLVAKNSLPYLAESVFGMEDEAIKRAVMEKYSHINRLTDQLQDLIMSMRMLPISYVFDRYPKLVREISKNLNKKVKLIQDGNETKLDKNMIEMLADPLIHIVRNSLDHGIETPADRVAKGKDETGTIKMRAYPQSDKVIIEIEDDGKGIDPSAIANKVIEKGLLPIEKIEAMSDQEKVELVMLPGLSMAEAVSEYSGRGVGMDVVRKSVMNFGGHIQIKSVIGRGTKITLSIPVSLALTTLLHILMGKNHYGIPMDYVSETVKIEREQITYLNGEPYIYIRDQIIPLFFIRGILEKELLDSKQLSIVVMNIKGNYLAVVVNELIGQLDVVQKPMDGLLANHPLISGTALLGNGSIIMIFDPIGLMELNGELKDRY